MITAFDIVSERLEPHSVRVATRKRHRLAPAREAGETVHVIRSGLYLARAAIPPERHQILGLIHPGDIVRGQALPPLDGTEITAASEQGEVWRLRWSTVEALTAQDAELARHIADRCADQAARLALHNAIVAGLTGDERVAALMLELALRTGRKTASGVTFEMPLSRMDIAEHLSLNADTVSRIVSRMRGRQLLAATCRDHLVCPSLDELAQACPLAPAIARLHGTHARLEPVA